MVRPTLVSALEHALEDIRHARQSNPELYAGLGPVIENTEQQIRILLQCVNPRSLGEISKTEHLISSQWTV